MLNNRRYWSFAIRCCIIAVLVVGILFFLETTVLAQNKPHAIVKSSTWNFGYLPQRCEVSHQFYLYNDGSAPLSVSKIKADCSCTGVSKIERPINPGDSAAIVVTFKSGRYLGLAKKSAEVYTNDPETPVQNLRIVSNVVKSGALNGGVGVTPQMLSWKIKNGVIAVNSDSVRIVNNSAKTMTVTTLQAPGKIIANMDVPSSISAGKTASMILHISSGKIIEDPAWLSITLALIGQDTTIFTIPIRIEK